MVVRFLLISQPRAGTMMLADALDQLPAVLLHNLFASNPDQPHRSHAAWQAFQWHDWPAEVTHLGTTMHWVTDDWITAHSPIPPAQFWPLLAHEHNRYVCLHRENQLHRFLSRKVGEHLGTFDVHQPRETKGPVPALALPLAEFAAFLADTQRAEALEATYFPGRLSLPYELLATDWPRAINLVQNYLGLPLDSLPPVTIKQETRSLRDAIANYAEVAAFCESIGKTEWLTL